MSRDVLLVDPNLMKSPGRRHQGWLPRRVLGYPAATDLKVGATVMYSIRFFAAVSIVMLGAQAALGAEGTEPVPTTGPTTQPERPFSWGRANRGLAIGVRTDRDTYVRGDPITVECAMKNSGRGLFRFELPPVDGVTASRFSDFLLVIVGRQPSQFSAKLREPGEESRVVTLEPGAQLIVRKVRVDTIDAFRYADSLQLRGGYPVAGQGKKLQSLGTFEKSLEPGAYQIGWIVYDRQRRWVGPMMLKSRTVAFTIEERAWETMTPEQRTEYLANLKAMLFRDAFSARDAVPSLVRIGKPAVPILLEGLNLKDHNLRAWAVTGLSGIQDPRCADALIRVLRTRPDMARYCAYHMCKQRSPKVQKALIEYLTTTKDMEARTWVIRGFRDHNRPMPEAIEGKLLADADARVRHAAVVYIADRRKGQAADMLRRVLAGDTDARVRGTAAQRLGAYGGKSHETLAPLVHALANDKSPFVKQMASMALSELTGKEWVYQTGEHITDAQRQAVVEKWQSWWAEQPKK